MEVTPELRRSRLPATPEGDSVLAGRIRDEIAEVGPMTFARFMELALYDAGHAFLNDTRPDMHAADQATLAWTKILGFLRRTL